MLDDEMRKHPTLNIFGTKKWLDEFNEWGKKFHGDLEAYLLWGNSKHCSYCDYAPCRCTAEAIEKRRMDGNY